MTTGSEPSPHTACRCLAHLRRVPPLPCSRRWEKTSGKDLDGRYEQYEEEYDEYARDCAQRGEQPEPKAPRPAGGFHAIPATKTVPAQLKELDTLRKRGIVKTSPPLPAADMRGETPWSTDAVELTPAQTLVCYQAALVHATASPLRALGTARPPT